MQPRPYILHEANYQQAQALKPNVAILPWGATEAHNYHLPHGTDVIEASILAERAAMLATDAGARVLVLPTIPFGNNAQQQDQVATVHLSTATAMGLLRDVTHSLRRQGIDRLLLLNAHGGNDFKPMIRDIQLESGSLIVLANFWQMCPEAEKRIFPNPGDHAGQLETSILLHVCPEWVRLNQAGKGERIKFAIEGLNQPGLWTPRPWSASHPDTGSGDPAGASADRGREYVDAVSTAIARALVSLSQAEKGQTPYL